MVTAVKDAQPCFSPVSCALPRVPWHVLPEGNLMAHGFGTRRSLRGQRGCEQSESRKSGEPWPPHTCTEAERPCSGAGSLQPGAGTVPQKGAVLSPGVTEGQGDGQP